MCLFGKQLKTFILLFIFCSPCIFPNIYGAQQLIPAGHWVYDALFRLNSEAGHISFGTDAPLTAAELKMYFDEIPYERLSGTGKRLYDKSYEYFKKRVFAFHAGDAFAAFNLNLNPLLMSKTSSDIDWTFATDYTGHIKSNGIVQEAKDRLNFGTGTYSKYSYSSENIELNSRDYGAASSFLSPLSRPFAEIPIYMGFGDNIILESIPMFGKSFWGMSRDSAFTNLTYTPDDVEFLWPRTANVSAGKSFDSWGVNVNAARHGLQRGRTLTGSIIYNSTFETDFYAQINLYCKNFKYNMDIAEINKNKYIYLHTIESRFFKFIKIGVTEGMLIQQPFELRFLNPLMIMHSFGAWDDYLTPEEDKYYGEAHVAAYMGIHVDVTPVKYLRLYFLYAQNEIQSPAEKKSTSGKVLPDSLGAQLGAELNIPDKTGGWWQAAVEGLYTSPFLYIKQGADWSLYSCRYDMQDNTSIPICSWIGSPLGPDCIGAAAKLEYSVPQKWTAGLNYLFVAHGTNSFGIFNNTVTVGGKTYYAYYPSVLRKLKLKDDDELIAMARTFALTGTVQYTNRIGLKGSYTLNSHFNMQGEAVYSFIFNNKNENGRFAHGLQFSLALNYNIF